MERRGKYRLDVLESTRVVDSQQRLKANGYLHIRRSTVSEDCL